MKHPEQDYATHEERMSRADKIKEEMFGKEVWEIFQRLNDAEFSADALGQARVCRARDMFHAALDRVAEALA